MIHFHDDGVMLVPGGSYGWLMSWSRVNPLGNSPSDVITSAGTTDLQWILEWTDLTPSFFELSRTHLLRNSQNRR